jgi:hypothetical protein
MARKNISLSASRDPGISTNIDVALWWPDPQSHNDVDLYLIDPNGTVAAQSTSGPSVFEKTQVATTITGTWQIKVVGYNIDTFPQVVYWAFLERN